MKSILGIFTDLIRVGTPKYKLDQIIYQIPPFMLKIKANGML